MSPMRTLPLQNAVPVPLDAVPVLSQSGFRTEVAEAVAGGARLCALFGQLAGDAVRLIAVLARDAAGMLSVVSTEASGSYAAITPECLQAHWFEREIAEQWGVRPDGHPWLKPIRFQRPLRPAPDPWHRDGKIVVGDTEFFRIEGEEIHEVAVGPVHAGVIEPGHFRFQCHGENVYHLEISLGYQHRGIERALPGGPTPRTIHYMETLAGDTTIGHATAYCHAVEALSGVSVPARAQAIRSLALELERIASHIGDLGALAGDVGYLPTASYCGRIRGDVLNLTALLCGNRFGRSLVRAGGVSFDLDRNLAATLVKRLEDIVKDATGAIDLLWETPSAMARFEGTGSLSRETGEAIGLVGPAARACGLERDVRRDFPSGMFRFAHIPVSSWPTGDVFARAYVRWLEVQRSCAFIREQIAALPAGGLMAENGPLRAESLVVSLVEGWRGEICHVAVTGADGKFMRYKVVDPSFHNWFGLACALTNQQISDFPLCNKSFNLSYCGHDL
ncbi:MAG: NADH-quinone oxidoreductase subunit C [Deltaproteobacteria bacterium]|nr:NADH-quinone oxidoreductase subunit C [Deltaproteobacteria bacterium]